MPINCRIELQCIFWSSSCVYLYLNDITTILLLEYLASLFTGTFDNQEINWIQDLGDQVYWVPHKTCLRAWWEVLVVIREGQGVFPPSWTSTQRNHKERGDLLGQGTKGGSRNNDWRLKRYFFLHIYNLVQTINYCVVYPFITGNVLKQCFWFFKEVFSKDFGYLCIEHCYILSEAIESIGRKKK